MAVWNSNSGGDGGENRDDVTSPDSWTSVDLASPQHSWVPPPPPLPPPRRLAHPRPSRRTEFLNCCVGCGCCLSLLLALGLLIFIPFRAVPATTVQVHVNIHPVGPSRTVLLVLEAPSAPPASLVFVYQVNVEHQSLVIKGPLLGRLNDSALGQLIMEEPERNLTIYRHEDGACFLHNSTGLNGSLDLPPPTAATPNDNGANTTAEVETLRLAVEFGRRTLAVASPPLGALLEEVGSQLALAHCQPHRTFWVHARDNDGPPPNAVLTLQVPHPRHNALIRQEIFL